MHKFLFPVTLLTCAVGGLIITSSAFAEVATPTTVSTGLMIACTADAKQCPDGSWVGRTGSDCAFVCPGSTSGPSDRPTSIITPPDEPQILPLGSIMRKGAQSDRIKDVQALLKSDPSIYTGPITGYFGPMTEDGLKKFQTKLGLPVTGILDQVTQNALFPSDTAVTLQVVSPNGGETWTAGQSVKISWTATFGPRPCMPPPSCLFSEPRCLMAEPIGGWCPSSTNSATPVPSTTGTAGDAYRMNAITTASAPSTGAGVSAGSVPSGTPAYASVPPFFPRATLTLLRDSDPSFLRNIGTVNLYESSRTWSIPRNIPEAKDYRVRISMGGDTPCIYRMEMEAQTTGKALDGGMAYPCPMMDSSLKTSTGASMGVSYMMPYTDYAAADMSDGTFVIIGGSDSTDIAALKRRLADAEAMLAKLAAEIASIRAALGAQ